MKSFWLYGALILVLLLMPAAPVLGEICMSLDSCPAAAVHDEPQTGDVAAPSLDEDHCREAVDQESSEPAPATACVTVLECCDVASSQPVTLAKRQETWSNHSLGVPVLSTDATQVSLDTDTWRSMPKVPPLEHRPLLFTLNSSLLL